MTTTTAAAAVNKSTKCKVRSVYPHSIISHTLLYHPRSENIPLPWYGRHSDRGTNACEEKIALVSFAEQVPVVAGCW